MKYVVINLLVWLFWGIYIWAYVDEFGLGSAILAMSISLIVTLCVWEDERAGE